MTQCSTRDLLKSAVMMMEEDGTKEHTIAKWCMDYGCDNEKARKIAIKTSLVVADRKANGTTGTPYDPLPPQASPQPPVAAKDDLLSKCNAAFAEMEKAPKWLNEARISEVQKRLQSLISMECIDRVNHFLVARGRRKFDEFCRELAIIFLIHQQSIDENEGESPFDRFVGASEQYTEVIRYPWNNDHISAAMKLAELINFTSMIEKPVRPRNGKKGQCAKYRLHFRL